MTIVFGSPEALALLRANRAVEKRLRNLQIEFDNASRELEASVEEYLFYKEEERSLYERIKAETNERRRAELEDELDATRSDADFELDKRWKIDARIKEIMVFAALYRVEIH
jgi:hypothetical protein